MKREFFAGEEKEGRRACLNKKEKASLS